MNIYKKGQRKNCNSDTPNSPLIPPTCPSALTPSLPFPAPRSAYTYSSLLLPHPPFILPSSLPN